jgi:hypothetical protein
VNDLPNLTPRDERPDVPPREPVRTVAGVIGLVFVLLAALCLPLGCATWGFAFFAVGPLAAVGLVFCLAARGRLQVVGITLGASLTVLGAAYWVLFITQGRK